jgi:lipid-A-disaccharide synthase-like uncharacterized protein
MPPYLIFGLGFLAQALFASRMIIQWVQSEKAGRVVSPTLFWQTSLIASLLLLIYGVLRHDLVVTAGQTLSYFIYIRNLQLKGSWKQFPPSLRVLFFTLPFLVYAVIIIPGYKGETLLSDNSNDSSSPSLMVMGLLGQLLMSLRFVYQWYYSERMNRSVFPKVFWILSVAGSLLIVGYASVKMDPVLLVAHSLGFIIYMRNIMLDKNSTVE